MKYKCRECGKIFDDLREERTTYENVYGVSGLFDSATPTTIYACPYCGSYDYNELSLEEQIKIEFDEIIDYSPYGKISVDDIIISTLSCLEITSQEYADTVEIEKDIVEKIINHENLNEETKQDVLEILSEFYNIGKNKIKIS